MHCSLAARGATLAALLLAACDGPPAPDSAVYTAAVVNGADQDGLSIGLAVSEGAVAALACGDDPARERYPGWFIGADAGDGTVRVARQGSILVASWSADGADGTLVEPDGTSIDWSAEPADGDRLTGLYAALDDGCMTGVVVADGGDARAPIVRGAWCSADGEQRQVTPLNPLGLSGGRLAVEVELDTGPRRLEVAPVELPMQ